MYKIDLSKRTFSKKDRFFACIGMLLLLITYWWPLVLGLYNGIVNAFEPSYIGREKIPDLYHEWNTLILIMGHIVIGREGVFYL